MSINFSQLFCWHDYKHIRTNGHSHVFQCFKCDKLIQKEDPKAKYCNHRWEVVKVVLDEDKRRKEIKKCANCGTPKRSKT